MFKNTIPVVAELFNTRCSLVVSLSATLAAQQLLRKRYCHFYQQIFDLLF